MEKNTMKDLLLLFGVTLPRRYTKVQKRIFYSEAEPLFNELGYSVTYQDSKNKFTRIDNMLIGNVEKAETVILCPYDTPARSFFQYKYYPFTKAQNLKQESKDLLLRMLIFTATCLLTYSVISQFSILGTLLKILGIVLIASLLMIAYFMLAGLASPINFNKNSASVALIASLAMKTRKNKAKVCYVLLDKNTDSNAGLKNLLQDERFKHKKFIFLDSVASGEKLVIAHRDAMMSDSKKISARLPGINVVDLSVPDEEIKDTILGLSPKTLHICVADNENNNYVVKNTRSKKDLKVDLPRLKLLEKCLVDFLGD